jgi:sugar phosphate isomerase/epimerase
LKLGLSTWCLLGTDVDSAVRSIGDAGFEYVELWGEVPHAHAEWADRKRLKDTLSAYNMVLTMHAPFTDLNPSSPFQPVKGAVERTLEDFVKFGAFLGATMVTVHPGSVHNEGLVPRSAQNSIETLRKMVKAANGRLSINVENQAKSRSKYHFPLASTTESLELILAEVDGARFTLDTGHAHVNGQDPLALAVRFESKLVEVHLSDNAGASDDHLIPGEGTAPLEGLLAKVAHSDLLVCLELDPHRYTEEQVLRAASETKIRLSGAPKGRA